MEHCWRAARHAQLSGAPLTRAAPPRRLPPPPHAEATPDLRELGAFCGPDARGAPRERPPPALTPPRPHRAVFAVVRGGLVDTLSGPGPFTVFA